MDQQVHGASGVGKPPAGGFPAGGKAPPVGKRVCGRVVADGLLLCVLVLASVNRQQARRYQQRRQLCHRYRKPNAVGAQRQRQQQHRCHLEQQRPQKGDQRGGEPVPQGRKEGRAKDVEPRKEEGNGVKLESPAGKLQQLRVVPNKDSGQGAGYHLGEHRHGHPGKGGEQDAFAQKSPELLHVFRPVVVADNGGAADGVADKNRQKNKVDVHNHPVGGHPVLPRQAHQLEVEEDVYQRKGDVGHQLGGTVCEGGQQHLGLRPCGEEAQYRVAAPQEVKKRDQPAHRLAGGGGGGGSRQPPPEKGHKEIVQHHVGDASGHNDGKPQLGPFRRDEEALEDVLEHKGDQGGQQDAAVKDTSL